MSDVINLFFDSQICLAIVHSVTKYIPYLLNLDNLYLVITENWVTRLFLLINNYC